MSTPRLFACLVVVAMVVPTLHAGDIVVRRNGESEASAPTFVAGATIAIACPTPVERFGERSLAELWIYDKTRASDPTGITVPNQAAGKVVVTGFPVDGMGHRIDTELRILVAGPDSTWPEQATGDLAMPDPGVTDLGTLTSSGIEIEDATLRANTRLAVYTADDIRGDITVGQVQRVRCGFNTTDATHKGTIYANITAVSIDVQFGGGSDRAIGYVKASNGIVGNLVAAGDAALFDAVGRYNYASIGRVVVGPSEAALGIQGDIRAELGRISSIYTTGPIGAAAVGNVAAKTPKIWAGDGISEILASNESALVDESGTPLVRAVPFRADIRTSRANALGRDHTQENPPPPDGYAPVSSNRQGGNIRRLATEGDLYGSIRVGMVSRVTDDVAGSGPAGIYVRGVCAAPITVEHVIEGQILAKRFEAPIVIGRMMEGSIIAWEGIGGAIPNTPTLASVRIGLGVAADTEAEAALLAEEDAALGAAFGRGFVGVDTLDEYRPGWPAVAPCYGNYASVGGEPSTFVSGMYIGQNLCDPVFGGYEEVGPPVIAAARIGAVEIGRLSVFEEEGLDALHPENTLPMIESPRIGSLRIDEFREGVVWSGKLDSATEVVNNNHADDYAEIGSVEIVCMGNGATLWAKDSVASGATPLTIHVAGNAHGQMHLPVLSSGATITIDGSLAAGEPGENDACGCAAFDASNACDIRDGMSPLHFTQALTDPSISPRNKGYDANASIDISQRAGLQGRVVINAANTDGTWAGAVRVAGETLAPHAAYTSSSRYFGGGVVGVVPFNFYQDDAFPPPGYPGGSNPDGDPVVRTNAIELLRVPWYGNVAPVAGKAITQAVLVLRAGTDGHPLATQPATPDYVAALVPTPFNTGRMEVAVRVPTGGSPVGGRYVVTNKLPNSTNRFLACEGFTASPHMCWCPTLNGFSPCRVRPTWTASTSGLTTTRMAPSTPTTLATTSQTTTQSHLWRGPAATR